MCNLSRILRSIKENSLEEIIVVLAIFITSLVLTQCYDLKITDKSTYHYFFNTVAQAFGGILAILLALLIFRLNNTDRMYDELTKRIIKTIGKRNIQYQNPLNLTNLFNHIHQMQLSNAKIELINTLKEDYNKNHEYRKYQIVHSYFVFILIGSVVFFSIVCLMFADWFYSIKFVNPFVILLTGQLSLYSLIVSIRYVYAVIAKYNYKQNL